MKKRNSKLFHWMMNMGLLKKFLTDHYVYMNIHYHTDYTPSDYQTSSYFKTMDLSDISEFEDLITTASDEDIPALKDIGS